MATSRDVDVSDDRWRGRPARKEPGSPQIALEGSPANGLPPWIISDTGCWNNMTGTPVEDCGSRSSLLTGSVRARRSWIFFSTPVLPAGGISASEQASGVAAGNLAISVTCDGGSTNQATSINAQINAAPANSVIEFPRGGCRFGSNGGVINDAVAGHVIHGNGATITKLSAGDAFTISGAGIVVDHLNENGQSYANGGFTADLLCARLGFYLLLCKQKWRKRIFSC